MKSTTDDLVMTEFNSNVATLQRIDILLRAEANAVSEGDLAGWYLVLYNLRREAIVKMGEDEWDEMEDKLKKIKALLKLWRRHPSDSVLQEDLEEHLDEYSLELRDFMDGKGMLLKDAEDHRGL